jgi:hypothetical protein
VAHLREQDVFLLQEALQSAFRGAAFSDVLKGEEDQWSLLGLIEILAGVQQHRAPAYAGKLLLDFEIFHHFGRGHDPVESSRRAAMFHCLSSRS